MMNFELRKDGDRYDLSGGPLEKPLRYQGIEYASRMVSFLSQVEGAELRIYDDTGELLETKTFRKGVRPGKGELGNV